MRVELELVLLRLTLEATYRRREIFFLGIVRGIPKEKKVADDVRTTRFEEVAGVDIVDF